MRVAHWFHFSESKVLPWVNHAAIHHRDICGIRCDLRMVLEGRAKANSGCRAIPYATIVLEAYRMVTSNTVLLVTRKDLCALHPV